MTTPADDRELDQFLQNRPDTQPTNEDLANLPDSDRPTASEKANEYNSRAARTAAVFGGLALIILFRLISRDILSPPREPAPAFIHDGNGARDVYDIEELLEQNPQLKEAMMRLRAREGSQESNREAADSSNASARETDPTDDDACDNP